jgi:hypothetical protein
MDLIDDGQNHLIDWVINEECIQICVGLYQILLVFTNDLIITIESNYLFSLDENWIELSGENPADSHKILCLLGQTITEASQSNDSIDISFSGEAFIKVVLDKSGFESLNITKKNKQITA